jgi:hypothetical protein
VRAVVEVEAERLVVDVLSSEPYSSFRSSTRLVVDPGWDI